MADLDPYETAVVHANVYAMADKYNIAGLRALARHKFDPYVPKCNSSQLMELIGLVFSTTPTSRKEIRSKLISECFQRMEELQDDQAFMHVLGEYADLGASLALKTYKKMSRKEKSLTHDLKVQNARMERVVEKSEEARDEIKTLEGRNELDKQTIQQLRAKLGPRII